MDLISCGDKVRGGRISAFGTGAKIASTVTFISDKVVLYIASTEQESWDKPGLGFDWALDLSARCQCGGTATQLPAEQFHSGSTPDVGLGQDLPPGRPAKIK